MSIGFLFLVYDDPHPIWKKWFPHINNVYIHCKSTNNNSYFKKQFIPTIPTEWGKLSLVQVMINLLEHTYKNTNISHFVFLSGNCIPIYDYIYTCDTISKFKNSSLHIFNHKLKKNIHNKFINSFTRHSQWCILLRKDVELILKSKNNLKLFSDVKIPDENYFGTILNYYNIQYINQITTHVNWYKQIKIKGKGKSPYMYTNLNNKIIKNILYHEKTALFLRKVDNSVQFNVINKYKNAHILKFN